MKRKPYGEAQARRLLQEHDEFVATGKTTDAFLKEKKVSVGTYYGWRKKYKHKPLKRGKHDWAKIIEDQQASGKEVREFCLERGLSPAAFYKARRRLNRHAPLSPPPNTQRNGGTFLPMAINNDMNNEGNVTIVMLRGNAVTQLVDSITNFFRGGK